jgi:DNA-binding CsgD family transcriptional regulator
MTTDSLHRRTIDASSSPVSCRERLSTLERVVNAPSPYPSPGAGGGSLTPPAREVSGQLSAGRSNRQIAMAMGLSPETVKTYLARAHRKINASNRAAAVWGMRTGLGPVQEAQARVA